MQCGDFACSHNTASDSFLKILLTQTFSKVYFFLGFKFISKLNQAEYICSMDTYWITYMCKAWSLAHDKDSICTISVKTGVLEPDLMSSPRANFPNSTFRWSQGGHSRCDVMGISIPQKLANPINQFFCFLWRTQY